MKNNVTSPLNRRAFLTLGAGALCAFGLSGCSSKGSYDDGYAAGYAAAIADMEQQKASIPTSGIEYTINSASLGKKEFGGEPVIVIELTGKNVGDNDHTVSFTGYELSVYQNGKALTPCPLVQGREAPDSRSVQAGVSQDGWIAYELLDTTTPVECKASSTGGTASYGLSNPQTIDLSTL